MWNSDDGGVGQHRDGVPSPQACTLKLSRTPFPRYLGGQVDTGMGVDTPYLKLMCSPGHVTV